MPNLLFEDVSKLTTEEGLKRSKLFLSRDRKIPEIASFIKEVQEEGKNQESLVIFLRRHWISLFTQIIPIFSITLLILLAYFFVNFFDLKQTMGEFGWQMVNFIVTLACLLLWVLFFVVFLDYYLDVWIVTNERIIDIRQKGLFRREISELPLDNVQDLTTEIIGVIPTLYDFGDLYIQTAGKRERFIFLSIPHPERIRDVILLLSEKEKESK